MKPDERAFEEHISFSLVEHGGCRTVKIGNASGNFDASLGLDLSELFAFIEATQPNEWSRLAKLHGGEAKARRQFADRLAKELDARGAVDVLRHGIVDLGVKVRLAFFKPAHGLTPNLVARYEANRLTATRQLPFEKNSGKTLDLALFVNGIPVATAELKNALTGQSVEDAKEQFRRDRDPKNTTLGNRAVVHFALDTEQVAMTTRLEGASTRFLPFNRGHDGGKGNPPNPEGHRTSYLWERVWERDAWLDLLGRFVHVERESKGKKAAGNTIFPRFHQWDAVLSLSAHARENGSGENYLVQHSAGSGKSNTIAWLAHRLSNFHGPNDEKVFDKVVVITDRGVLDKQLQETIYQFEHAHGVVVKIGESSSQLAETLSGETARIIITTLQKFPFVLDKVEDLSSRRYAVLVDEAHSSQTGETAKDMKKALGSGPVEDTELAAEGPGDGYAAESSSPAEDALAREVAARGRQPNLSFFAFTATQSLVDDERIQRQAAANSEGNFGVRFPKHFEKAVVERLEGTTDFTLELLRNEEMSEQIRSVYMPLVYGRAKVAWQEHCPIGELLGPPPKEGKRLEYKSTLRTHAGGEDEGELFKPLQSATIKTIAAFFNSPEGGTLLIGVSDDGSIFGLEGDYAALRKEGKDDRDLFLLHLSQTIINAVGMAAAANVGQEILEVGGRDLCRVHVKPSSFPVRAEVVEVDKNGQHAKKDVFYGRFGNGTRAINDSAEWERYQVQVWG